MRTELAPLLGLRRTFSATFDKTGRRNVRYYVPDGRLVQKEAETILLVDVKSVFNRVLCDQLWFTAAKVWERANLKPGDRVKFDARVETYHKRYRAENDEGFLVEDFKLAYPTNVNKVSQEPVGVQSFFEQLRFEM